MRCQWVMLRSLSQSSRLAAARWHRLGSLSTRRTQLCRAQRIRLMSPTYVSSHCQCIVVVVVVKVERYEYEIYPFQDKMILVLFFFKKRDNLHSYMISSEMACNSSKRHRQIRHHLNHRSINERKKIITYSKTTINKYRSTINKQQLTNILRLVQYGSLAVALDRSHLSIVCYYIWSYVICLKNIFNFYLLLFIYVNCTPVVDFVLMPVRRFDE